MTGSRPFSTMSISEWKRRLVCGFCAEQVPRPGERVRRGLVAGEKQRQGLIADLLVGHAAALSSSWARSSIESRSPLILGACSAFGDDPVNVLSRRVARAFEAAHGRERQLFQHSENGANTSFEHPKHVGESGADFVGFGGTSALNRVARRLPGSDDSSRARYRESRRGSMSSGLATAQSTMAEP